MTPSIAEGDLDQNNSPLDDIITFVAKNLTRSISIIRCSASSENGNIIGTSSSWCSFFV
jgi:hypothetical protein